MFSQLEFSDPCKGEPILDNNDFSLCFREFYLESVLPLLYLVFSLFALLIHYVRVYRTHQHPYRLIPTTDENRQEDEDEDEDEDVVEEEGDQFNKPSSPSVIAHDVAKALIIVAISALELVEWSLRKEDVENGKDPVNSWWHICQPLVSAIAWIVMTLLTFTHLLESLNSKHNSATRIITTLFFIFSLPFAFLNLRSALINPYPVDGHLKLIIPTIVLTTVLGLLALFEHPAPKPDFTIHPTPSPEPSASIYERAVFAWINPLMWLGYKRHLTRIDVWQLTLTDTARYIVSHFHKKNPVTARKLPLLFIFIKHFSSLFLEQFAWSVLWGTTIFIPPLFLQSILLYVEDPNYATREQAYLFAVGLLLGTVIFNLAANQALYVGRKICIKLRALVIEEVFEKSLRRREGVSQKNENGKENNNEGSSNGKIVTLISVDAIKVSNIAGSLHDIYTVPLQIAIAIFYLYRLLGWSALAGVMTMAILIPINWWFAAQFQVIQRKLLAITDHRMHLTNELLNGIRIIKYFAWERSFASKILEVRSRELKVLRENFNLGAFSQMVYRVWPVLVTFLVFFSYTTIAGQELTAAKVFTAIALFQTLASPLNHFPRVVSNVLQAKVSIERVERFLNEEETEKYQLYSKDRRVSPSDPVLGFTGAASYRWGSSYVEPTSSGHQNFQLRNLDIAFPPTQLSLIVGPTGSGKTSLLSALLGEMTTLQGYSYLPRPGHSAGLNPGIAYVAQTSWLQNATIRDNILFGEVFNPERYRLVLEACALERDLEIFTAGDQTEIGERGVTLSGGQKQRVSLARAVYSNAGTILLDDCLSAVDAHTARWIYEKCLTGPICQGRTRVLVTHAIGLTIPGAKFMVVLEKGTVIAQGSPEEVIKKGVLTKEILTEQGGLPVTSSTEERSELTIEQMEETIVLAKAKDKLNVDKGKLIAEEEQAEGSIKFSTYKTYLKAAGSPGFLALVVTGYFIEHGLRVMSNWWLKMWSHAYEVQENIPPAAKMSWVIEGASINDTLSTMPYFRHSSVNTVYYLVIYGIISLVFAISVLISMTLVFIASLSASRILFTELLDTILSATFRVYDTTPVGRILNRFSKDIQAIDQEVASNLGALFTNTLGAFIIISVVIWVTPAFLLAAIIITLIYLAIGIVYVRTSRELKRIESVTRSPIFQSFGEVLNGVVTVRAYGAERRFKEENLARIDNTNAPYFYLTISNAWLSIRIDLWGSLVSFFAAVFIIFASGPDGFMDAALAGFSMIYALEYSFYMLWVVKQWSLNEINLNSIERVQEYLDIQREPPAIIANSRPGESWPDKGTILVENLAVKYAPGLPPVLKNLNFEVRPHEKVGIVGRTGSGKSTLAISFFRFIEATEGRIVIDGVDISKIGLRDLRERLTIIPQDPVLFIGTVRSNLDPFTQYDDAELWNTLRSVQLVGEGASAGGSDADGKSDIDLQTQVAENGSNFSHGQRQLIGLARALLRKSRVILMDEATASVDFETDARIQKTIRVDFKESTILCIAHRLKTIIDFDRVLVLDDGALVEFDHPWELIQREGVFKSMCEHSGEYENLLEMANKAGRRYREEST